MSLAHLSFFFFFNVSSVDIERVQSGDEKHCNKNYYCMSWIKLWNVILEVLKQAIRLFQSLIWFCNKIKLVLSDNFHT